MQKPETEKEDKDTEQKAILNGDIDGEKKGKDEKKGKEENKGKDEEKKKGEGNKDEEKKEDLETDEAKKIVEALTKNSAEACKSEFMENGKHIHCTQLFQIAVI